MLTLRPILLSLSCAAGLFAVSGCYQLPKARGYDVDVHAGTIREQNPRDIAIGPVLVVHEGVDVPDFALRRGFQRGLVKRRYSPLALEQVDNNLIEASYRAGRLEEDAALEIVVYTWDDSQWDTRSVLTFDVEARLIDPEGSAIDPLWAGRLEKRMPFTQVRDVIPSNRAQMERACEVIADEILAALPQRVARVGG